MERRMLPSAQRLALFSNRVLSVCKSEEGEPK